MEQKNLRDLQNVLKVAYRVRVAYLRVKSQIFYSFTK